MKCQFDILVIAERIAVACSVFAVGAVLFGIWTLPVDAAAAAEAREQLGCAIGLLGMAAAALYVVAESR